jgi:hypothetical protein
MNIEQKFKEETGFDSYTDNDLRPKVPSDYYVEWLEEQVEQLISSSVSTTLPNIDSNTFKNWLEIEGYAETLNPLVYRKNGFEYDKERLHKHFINMIEFGN